jgi:hypothetical protein
LRLLTRTPLLGFLSLYAVCSFSLRNQSVVTELTHVSAATDRHENIRETVGDGDLYSVSPGVIKGGHVIDPALSDSEGSSVAELG